jgi:hypothetical protein
MDLLFIELIDWIRNFLDQFPAHLQEFFHTQFTSLFISTLLPITYPLNNQRNRYHTQRKCLPWWSAASVYGVDVLKLVRRAIRCRRGGELLDEANDVRIAQLDNCISRRGMICQARNMTVNRFPGG